MKSMFCCTCFYLSFDIMIIKIKDNLEVQNSKRPFKKWQFLGENYIISLIKQNLSSLGNNYKYVNDCSRYVLSFNILIIKILNIVWAKNHKVFSQKQSKNCIERLDVSRINHRGNETGRWKV